jgi:hypothetical protein
MASRRKRTQETQIEPVQGQQPAKKTTPVGPDLALTLPTTPGKALELSYWDLWFALVAVRLHDGDLDRLSDHLKNEKGFYYSRDSTERKRWHLRDLSRRLGEASVTLTRIVEVAGDLAKAEKRRAITKVLESCDRASAWSEPMRNTPRKHRLAHALRGYWGQFPVSPQSYDKKIGAHFQSKGFYTESMSFKIARTLDGYAEQATKLVEVGKSAEAQAILRGWMTAVIELMGHADDSFGSIGMSFGEGFTAYLKIPLEKTGIDDSIFFPDLLNFLIWEDYWLTNDEIEGYFKGLTPEQEDLCIEHLRREIDELKGDDLEYEGEEALTLLGQVVAERERFDMFECLAKEMGSREWRRIIRLVDRAVKKRKRSLACKVFEAALTKGSHLDFLTKKYEQLKAGKWDPDPRR